MPLPNLESSRYDLATALHSSSSWSLRSTFGSKSSCFILGAGFGRWLTDCSLLVRLRLLAPIWTGCLATKLVGLSGLVSSRKQLSKARALPRRGPSAVLHEVAGGVSRRSIHFTSLTARPSFGPRPASTKATYTSWKPTTMSLQKSGHFSLVVKAFAELSAETSPRPSSRLLLVPRRTNPPFTTQLNAGVKGRSHGGAG